MQAFAAPAGARVRWAYPVALVLAIHLGTSALAQESVTLSVADVLPVSSELVPVDYSGGGCPSCSSGLLGSLGPPPLGGMGPPPGSCASCGGGGCANCVPGRYPCNPSHAESFVGRLFCGIRDCICCPDPCYEPVWTPVADSAFFVESARPVTQQRFRYDSGANFLYPDRSEYFWARADGSGRGPKPVSPFKGETRLRTNELNMITEGGTGRITVITEMPYRNIQPQLAPHASGFSDLSIATKTLLFDCELLQIAFMMRTFIPSGSTGKGLGVGHVSLEPSLLVGLKLSPTTHFQGQLSEWIPIAGDPAYAGAILHYRASVNQQLWTFAHDIVVVGTCEFMGYSFQDGLYTDPILGSQKSSGYSYAYLGSGLRVSVCNRLDFGAGAMFALTEQHFAGQMYRVEFRVRY